MANNGSKQEIEYPPAGRSKKSPRTGVVLRPHGRQCTGYGCLLRGWAVSLAVLTGILLYAVVHIARRARREHAGIEGRLNRAARDRER
jgi:hypothetical protein